MARRRFGKMLRDGIIFGTGVAGFSFEIYAAKSPNIGVMALCSTWALTPAIPAFLPDNFWGNMLGRYQVVERPKDEPK